MRPTVLCVIGTRPEAIKMVPVVEELGRRADHVRTVVCSTGQHRQMLDQVFQLFGIVPEIDLGLMVPDQGLLGLAADLLRGLDRAIDEVHPDWILAQGDTTTVFAASVAAYYKGVRFGHVEAGLRTGDKRRPFPEEGHRRLASVVADAHFAPTAGARQALLREGVPDDAIFLTGNTIIDAVRRVASTPFDATTGPLAGLPADRRLVLVTAHRRESFGAPLRAICEAIRDLAREFADDGVHFVYPVHLNPKVQEPARATLGGEPNIRLIDPLDYASMVHLMARSALILTDSGGIQEEAPSLGVPTLVLRETTERPEGLDSGLVRLVGTSRARIVEEAARWLRHPPPRDTPGGLASPYGDGRAARRIVSAILGEG